MHDERANGQAEALRQETERIMRAAEAAGHDPARVARALGHPPRAPIARQPVATVKQRRLRRVLGRAFARNH